MRGADEQRIAAHVRHLQRIHHRAERRVLLIGQIGVPVLPGVGPPLAHAVDHHVGEAVDLGMALEQVLGENVDHERAEPAAERDVLLRRQLLIMEHENRMPLEGRVDRVERRVRQRL
jgi:hypothetical protein